MGASASLTIHFDLGDPFHKRGIDIWACEGRAAVFASKGKRRHLRALVELGKTLYR
jgi:hypothetical protein